MSEVTAFVLLIHIFCITPQEVYSLCSKESLFQVQFVWHNVVC